MPKKNVVFFCVEWNTPQSVSVHETVLYLEDGKGGVNTAPSSEMLPDPNLVIGVADKLKNVYKVKCDFYHAELPNAKRSEI